MGRPATSHGPERQCRVCRIRLPKTQLERWVITPTGLVLDSSRSLPGRGWYACSKPSCSRHITQAITGQAKKAGRWPLSNEQANQPANQHVSQPVDDPPKSKLTHEANSA